jgi:hypothetical protein
MDPRQKNSKGDEELREVGYSTPEARLVAIIGYVISLIPVVSFVSLFFIQDTLLKLIFGFFVVVGLFRIFLNAHIFKYLEFRGTELLLKIRR